MVSLHTEALKYPKGAIRMICIITAIFVFGLIADEDFVLVGSSEKNFILVVSSVAFVASIGLLIYYLITEPGSESETFIYGDFAFTLLLTLFWFAGSIAWAVWTRQLPGKSFGKTKASVVFSFLNWLLWTAASWYTLKDTPYWRSRHDGSGGNSYDPNMTV